MLRCILTFGYLILHLAITSPYILYLKQVEKKEGRKRACYLAQRPIQRMFFICEKLSGVRLSYVGLENIPKDQAFLLVGNHKSYFDIILSYGALPDAGGYVAKKELGKPVLGWWMRAIGCIFLDREDPRSSVEMIKTAVNNIKEGISVIIFPEGTRIRDRGKFGDFSDGSLKIAQRSKSLVVPMSICGTYDLWEAQFPHVKPGKVIIEFGQPIDLSQLEGDDKKHPGRYVKEIIYDMYEKNLEKMGKA